MKITMLRTEFESHEDEIQALKEHIDRLEKNREKLISSLEKKKVVDNTLNVHLDEDDLVNFDYKSDCDKKLLALLFWDKLSDPQKKIFSDIEQMEIRSSLNKKLEGIMTDPVKMRQHFLKGSAPILDKMLKAAANTDRIQPTVDYAMKEVWEVLKSVITNASNPAPLIDLKGKEISAQIDEILTQLTSQNITMDEAKELMGLVSSGFNLQQLPILMQKLEMLESK